MREFGEMGEESAANSGEERILVSVRLRPLNSKEIARNDVSDWECINDNTIIFKNSVPERSMLPTAYTFDRVFHCDCSTKQVYEEAAKAVALSVLNGINSSIFAYGQTSSGKTFTMSGITEYTLTDIFDYIQKHEERAFILKFSALEIYNEAVRDLLSADATPLRLLDDPERGTTVERLTEETLTDWNHLQELLSICEAQRQIGETCLNETSSRSHQILRLTIESCAREFLGMENSSTLAASVNFVDLAGSERASQTLSAGTRLKEGCHINRSLLTLGTVVRKLSKGRNGHIPYRDSKLTRILQSSLGGNARTAIICTISPARSHIEQSRNTLSFASCAKEVATSANVNVVMSDKALVKHLQRELARLESALTGQGLTSGTIHSQALLKEKDVQIQKMEKEMEEIIQQRDLAQWRLGELLRVLGDDQDQRLWADSSQPPRAHSPSLCQDELSSSERPGSFDRGLYHGFSNFNIDQDSRENRATNYDEHFLENSDIPGDQSLSGNTSPHHPVTSPRFVGPVTQQSGNDISYDAHDDAEDLCKEVRCIEESSMDVNEEDNALFPKQSENLLPPTASCNTHGTSHESVSLVNGDRDVKIDSTNVLTEQKLEDGPKTMDNLKPCSDESSTRLVSVDLTSSANSCLKTGSSSGLEAEEPNVCNEDCHEGIGGSPSALDYGDENGKLSREYSQIPEHNASDDMPKTQHIETTSEKNITCIHSSVAGLKEIDEPQYQEKLADDLMRPSTRSLGDMIQCRSQVSNEATPKVTEDLTTEKTKRDVGLDPMQTPSESPLHWSFEFERKQREIIELWDACNISLVHRTYFFLLFKGDPADSIYMEVELRRLSFLKNMFSQEKLGKPAVEDGHITTHASSMKALRRERELLSKQMQKSHSAEERNNLYKKWGIDLDSKQRKLQLAHLLWTETRDIDHIRESAAIVAKLIGFLDQGQALKEMFSLSFTPQLASGKSYSWLNCRSYFGTSYL